jgi:hypothetical protein
VQIRLLLLRFWKYIFGQIFKTTELVLFKKKKKDNAKKRKRKKGSHFRMLIKIHFGCACLAAYRLELRQPTAVGTAKAVYNRLSLPLSLSLSRATGVLLQRVLSTTTALPPLFIHSNTHSFSEHLFISFTFLTIRIKPGAFELGLEETHSLKHFLIACFKLETCISSLFLKQLFPSVLIVS